MGGLQSTPSDPELLIDFRNRTTDTVSYIIIKLRMTEASNYVYKKIKGPPDEMKKEYRKIKDNPRQYLDDHYFFGDSSPKVAELVYVKLYSREGIEQI